MAFPPLPVLWERVGVRVFERMEWHPKTKNNPHPIPLPEYRERGPERFPPSAMALGLVSLPAGKLYLTFLANIIDKATVYNLHYGDHGYPIQIETPGEGS